MNEILTWISCVILVENGSIKEDKVTSNIVLDMTNKSKSIMKNLLPCAKVIIMEGSQLGRIWLLWLIDSKCE
jgi:hypothetical protein